jgi:hypothetical protein
VSAVALVRALSGSRSLHGRAGVGLRSSPRRLSGRYLHTHGCRRLQRQLLRQGAIYGRTGVGCDRVLSYSVASYLRIHGCRLTLDPSVLSRERYARVPWRHVDGNSGINCALHGCAGASYGTHTAIIYRQCFPRMHGCQRQESDGVSKQEFLLSALVTA